VAGDEDRWCELKAQLEILKSGLGERLDKLEGQKKKPTTLGQRLLDILAQALVPIISGGVILLLGYGLKDSVDQALRREQLNLSYASQMQELLEKMRAPGATREQAEAAAQVLATFGNPAVAPLVSELQFEGLRSLAAEGALRTMALTTAESACEVLPRVLDNRSRLYDWQTHQRAIRLLGDLECSGAAEGLRTYRQQVADARPEDGYQGYARLLRSDAHLDRDSVGQVLGALDQTLEILK
jgi:hypothetical protein